jgi:adenylate kinase
MNKVEGKTGGMIRLLALIGPPGSGKSTQAELLTEKINSLNPNSAVHVNVGQILRSRNDDEEIKELERRGELVPDHIVFEVLKEEFKTLAGKVVVLDGFFRRKGEAKWLIDNQKNLGLEIEALIDIRVGRAESIKRLSSRGREDDDPEDIPVRLKIFNKERRGVLWAVKMARVLRLRVDGNSSREEVFKEICEELEEYNLF